jgi:hypothetical protein
VTDRECIGRMRDSVLSQLIELGTIQACKSIELLIQQLPEVTWLSKNLIIARENMRRKAWRSPTPEEILQLVVTNEPSNLELQDTLNSMGRNIQQMADEPKIDQSVHIKDSKISGGINTGRIETAKAFPSDKRLDLKFWIPIIVTVVMGLLAILASGVFNEEIRKFFLDGIVK